MVFECRELFSTIQVIHPCQIRRNQDSVLASRAWMPRSAKLRDGHWVFQVGGTLATNMAITAQRAPHIPFLTFPLRWPPFLSTKRMLKPSVSASGIWKQINVSTPRSRRCETQANLPLCMNVWSFYCMHGVVRSAFSPTNVLTTPIRNIPPSAIPCLQGLEISSSYARILLVIHGATFSTVRYVTHQSDYINPQRNQTI